ncbi:unnamed protein product, partial [Cyprideis torosa]
SKIILTGKARRLKQAKEEAQAEIEQYRQERERQFKEYESKHMGTRTDIAARIDSDTKSKIIAMNDNVNNNREEVIAALLQHILTIKPEVHRNFFNQKK